MNARANTRESFDRPWTSGELTELRKLAPLGALAAAEVLERSVSSVKNQARRQRISLRRDGERRGRVLGQPRDVRMADAAHEDALARLRDDVLNGRIDADRVARRTQLIATGAPLCPSCAIRPVEVLATGTCSDCHMKALAAAHAMEADTLATQRLLDRERQRKHRAQAGKETP